jgi:sec-independent protein translocase protein TatC
MPEDEGLSFLQHLGELRHRLIRVVLVVVLTSAAGFVLTPRILALLLAPYGGELRVLGPTEGVSTYLRIALTFGVAAALPYILFEAWGFIAPGLLPRERRYAFTIIPTALVLFLTGGAFAWFVLIPTAIRFLAGFLPGVFQVQWTSERYIPFVTSLLFWVGICFELPLAAWFLARLHVVNARMLLRVWRYAMVAIAVLAAVITPTVDPFNMGLVAVPLGLLYFISVAVAALAQRGS